VYLELEKIPNSHKYVILTFLHLIADRYNITSSQGRPQFSVGRPWPTRTKSKTATAFQAQKAV